jgi:hypothetical protein
MGLHLPRRQNLASPKHIAQPLHVGRSCKPHPRALDFMRDGLDVETSTYPES